MFDSIAIVGATGAVGQLIRNMLEERDFPYEKITFLASARSAGSTIEFKGKKHTVKELTPEAFEGIDLSRTLAAGPPRCERYPRFTPRAGWAGSPSPRSPESAAASPPPTTAPSPSASR